MKLALLQCNVTNGDLAANSARLLECVRLAGKTDLCIAAEGSLTGPGGNIGKRSGYLEEMRNTLDNLASSLPAESALLCHAPEFGHILMQDGAWRITGDKFSFCGKIFGIDLRPGDETAIDIGIAMKPRPFSPGANDEWELILSGFCQQGHIWVLSVNLCGGYGDHVYSGESLAMGPDGCLKARARAFAEDCLVVETSHADTPGRIEPAPESRQEATWLALTLGLRDFVRKSNAQKALLGISGGMDSAMVACIASYALGSENVTGVSMPSPYTSRESREDAALLAQSLGINFLELPINEPMRVIGELLEPAFAALDPIAGGCASENVQARLRALLLMALANHSGALVLNCGNKSEAAMGYCTLYGDTVGAIAVIGDLLKTQVYELGEWLCRHEGRQVIPERIFLKAPSAELRPNQKDTDSLPPYPELDPKLRDILRHANGLTAAIQPELAQLSEKIAKCAFKRRQSAPPLLVSSWPLEQSDF